MFRIFWFSNKIRKLFKGQVIFVVSVNRGIRSYIFCYGLGLGGGKGMVRGLVKGGGVNAHRTGVFKALL